MHTHCTTILLAPKCTTQLNVCVVCTAQKNARNYQYLDTISCENLGENQTANSKVLIFSLENLYKFLNKHGTKKGWPCLRASPSPSSNSENQFSLQRKSVCTWLTEQPLSQWMMAIIIRDEIFLNKNDLHATKVHLRSYNSTGHPIKYAPCFIGDIQSEGNLSTLC